MLNTLDLTHLVLLQHIASFVVMLYLLFVPLTRLTTCLENLEMSGNLTAVREMSGILLKIRGENLVREKLPKTVYCKLNICIHADI